jgi:hypothetical protein
MFVFIMNIILINELIVYSKIITNVYFLHLPAMMTPALTWYVFEMIGVCTLIKPTLQKPFLQLSRLTLLQKSTSALLHDVGTCWYR